MRTRLWLLTLAATVIVTSATVIAFAQEPQKQSPEKPAESTQDNQPASKKKEEDGRGLIISTDLVIVNVSVTDSSNRQIPDLTRHDFDIAEDGVKQQIDFFIGNGSPVNFSLAFDISDHEPLKLMAQQAAWGFVKQIRSTDEVAIPQLKAGREAVRDFTADERKLENALSKISLNDKSPLFDVLAEGIKDTREKRVGQRRITVVITDGLSLSGTASDREAAYAILRESTPIYFIILDDGRYRSRPASQSRVRQTRDLLTRIAEVSGGQALVVKREDEIAVATEQIIHRLKNQYTMGYYPTNDKHDGAFRYLRVTVTPKDKRKVNVFAPLGYYAPDATKIGSRK